MGSDHFHQRSASYLKKLCDEIGDRSVGSHGNLKATRFFLDEMTSMGWNCDSAELGVVDWQDGGALLQSGKVSFQVLPSPYSLGCDLECELVCASTVDELEQTDISGKILLLHGEIAAEQLMPKNFVFYNPDEHRKIIALLEEKGPAALVCATGRNSSLAGGVYPFPLIEDGDFDIPSVYMTEEEGIRLFSLAGDSIALKSNSRRIPAKAYNVVAHRGKTTGERIVLTAHIDAKKGTPGAIDNATGVVVLLLVAYMLGDYDGEMGLEMAALNGEDYYAVPGQMDYIRRNMGEFDRILLNINIDGAGYMQGESSFSLFGLTDALKAEARRVIEKYSGIIEGVQWAQGDHSIFIQQGCPAIAVSSKWFIDNMDSQTITHTPGDNLGIVDCGKVVEIARALNDLIRRLAGS